MEKLYKSLLQCTIFWRYSISKVPGDHLWPKGSKKQDWTFNKGSQQRVKIIGSSRYRGIFNILLKLLPPKENHRNCSFMLKLKSYKLLTLTYVKISGFALKNANEQGSWLLLTARYRWAQTNFIFDFSWAITASPVGKNWMCIFFPTASDCYRCATLKSSSYMYVVLFECATSYKKRKTKARRRAVC